MAIDEGSDEGGKKDHPRFNIYIYIYIYILKRINLLAEPIFWEMGIAAKLQHGRVCDVVHFLKFFLKKIF
jgi:hypothetical protein